MLELVNPILETVADERALAALIEEFSIVPHFGNNERTSHRFTKLIEDITELSQSHTA